MEEVPGSGGDEFAQFVKVFSLFLCLQINSPFQASIHPPNELSLPRCYPDLASPSLLKNSPSSLISSCSSPSRSPSPASPSLLGPRPRLRRERAQVAYYHPNKLEQALGKFLPYVSLLPESPNHSVFDKQAMRNGIIVGGTLLSRHRTR